MRPKYGCPEKFRDSGVLPVPEIIAIGFLCGAANPNLGEEEVGGGRGWFHSKERW